MDLPRINLLTLDYLKHKGFSLVEILIVIAIIGILSGLALSFTGALQKNTRDAQRSSDLSVIQSALQQYYADQNKYPDDLTSELTGGSALTDCSGKVTPCTPTKTYLSKTPKDPSGSVYYFRPVENIRTPLSNCSVGGGVVCHYYFLCAKMESPPSGSTCVDINFSFQLTPL
jgi:prepilin-type N-terminal cleavage/methylation domain-containing protein